MDRIPPPLQPLSDDKMDNMTQIETLASIKTSLISAQHGIRTYHTRGQAGDWQYSRYAHAQLADILETINDWQANDSA